MSDTMSDKISHIKSLIGTDSKVVEEIIKHCNQIKQNTKILDAKTYVLDKIDKTYDLPIIEQYLDKITNLQSKGNSDNSYDCHHEVTVDISFTINNMFVKLKCGIVEDDTYYFIIEIDDEKIILDESWAHEYCMVNKDNNITNFNLEHYYQLESFAQTYAYNGYIEHIIYETDFDVANYNDFDETKYLENENEKGVIDLKNFVNICKIKCPDVNPIQLFDVIMLFMIHCVINLDDAYSYRKRE